MANLETTSALPNRFKHITPAVKETSSFRKSLLPRLKQYFAGICRLIILTKLKSLHTGSFILREIGHKDYEFGNNNSGLSGFVEILDEGFWPRLLFLGPMGFAEAFMDGIVECSDVTQVLEVHAPFPKIQQNVEINSRKLLIINRDSISDFNSLSSWFVSIISGIYRAANTPSVSLSNVSKHYDLSNRIFASFLSPDMTYSCPIWSTTADSLEAAQLHKLHKIISEAQIKPTDHVLEVGTGWGSFSIEAVRQTGCKVTTVTLSIEQKEEAEARIAAAGFSTNIQVLLKDYREIEKIENGYDKIVSIEMLEHVGRENHNEYFECVHKLLNARKGIAVFQTSTLPEARYDAYCRGTDFIRKHIFPGANVPSVTQIINAIHRGSAGKLIPDKVENIGGHYIKTLRIWGQNFQKNFSSEICPELLKLNPSFTKADIEVFKRKWQWYFSYCEAGFATRTLGCVIFTVGREGNMEMIREVEKAL